MYYKRSSEDLDEFTSGGGPISVLLGALWQLILSALLIYGSFCAVVVLNVETQLADRLILFLCPLLVFVVVTLGHLRVRNLAGIVGSAIVALGTIPMAFLFN